MAELLSLGQGHFVYNGRILQTNQFSEKLVEGDRIIYEVVHVVKSTPVFFLDHIKRLKNSILRSSLAEPSYDQLVSSTKLLLDREPVAENNIKISVVYRLNHEKPDSAIYFIPSKYPTYNDKHYGVSVKTVNATRLKPEIKVENKTLRKRADEIIDRDGYYEVLLVNNEGYITEGSRSNIFFVKSGGVVTASSDMVLSGITRDKVLQICAKLGVGVAEDCLNANQLSEIDGGFITGTSPGVLAIGKVDDVTLDVNIDLIKQIALEYEALIQAEVENRQKQG